jgi:hypothetical protein
MVQATSSAPPDAARWAIRLSTSSLVAFCVLHGAAPLTPSYGSWGLFVLATMNWLQLRLDPPRSQTPAAS